MKNHFFLIRLNLYALLLLSITIPKEATAAGYTINYGHYIIYAHGGGANLVADSAHLWSNPSADVHVPSSITYTYTYTERIDNQMITLTRSVPCPVTAINQNAFKGSGITSFSMPNNVRAVRKESAYDPLVYTNRLDFSGCDSLKHASLGELIKSFTFRNCKSLTSVSLPNPPSSVEDYCFYGCHSLADFNFSNLRHIGFCAFDGCESLKHISIPESLQTIGGRSFERWWDTIEDVEWNAINCKLYLPDFIKSTLKGLVDSSAYEVFGPVRHLTIGPNVKYIGDYIFGSIWHGWVQTETLTFNSTNYEGSYIYSPETSKIIIGNNVKTLPQYLIRGDVTEITIPSSVTLTRPYVVHSETSLKTINWNAVSCTAEGPFLYDYFNLTDIVIGSGVSYIGGHAFNSGVNYGDETPIQTVTCHAIVPPVIDPDCFNSAIYNNATLRVPKGSLEAYRNAEGWKNFFKCVAIEDIPGGGEDNKLLGDVNGDGIVDVVDVVALIDYVLGNNPQPFDAEAADMNEDKLIDVQDVVALIDKVLGNN